MSCGLYLVGLMGLAGVVLSVVLRFVRLAVVRDDAPATISWWTWLYVAPATLILVGLTAMLLGLTFRVIEWLAFAGRRCRRCRARRWSWGFTRGFGL